MIKVKKYMYLNVKNKQHKTSVDGDFVPSGPLGSARVKTWGWRLLELLFSLRHLSVGRLSVIQHTFPVVHFLVQNLLVHFLVQKSAKYPHFTPKYPPPPPPPPPPPRKFKNSRSAKYPHFTPKHPPPPPPGNENCHRLQIWGDSS